ncbi:MAG: YegP family protein [Angelakisella sp.]|nr:YegP family protein [Angelakisella sp.]
MTDRVGIFLVSEVGSNEFYFTLKATNGEAIGISQSFLTYSACIDGINSVRKYAATAEMITQGEAKYPKFDIFTDDVGKYRFCLYDADANVILASGAYTTKASAINGCEAVKKYSPAAVVEEQDNS